MSDIVSTFVAVGLKASAALLVANEIRGLILTVPVLYGLYQAGGTLMAIWLAISSLGGIALSVVIPLALNKKAKRYLDRRLARRAAQAEMAA
jgi:hypothetical protein